MTIIDQLIDTWIRNANTTVSHPSDTSGLDKIVFHGYKRVKGFTSSNLRKRIESHGHNFDEDTMDSLMERVGILLSFCRSNFPKPPSREQIEYNRNYDPVNGRNRPGA